ncbi:MAG: CerR family C-terminal domain-containing protein, partial [Planctomycetota bacterium]
MSEDASDTTEGRLLQAAVGLFASQGFAATRVRQVCDQAEANVAAVNYHFRSKRGLYDAAIDHARAASVERSPWVALDANRNFWAHDEPEVRLHRFVSMMLDHALDEHGRPSELARILIHEMLDPTEAFERQVDVSIRRVFEALADICRQVRKAAAGRAPRSAAERQAIDAVVFLIGGQCMYPALVAGLPDPLYPGVSFDADGRVALADRITASALAQLQAVDAAPQTKRKTKPNTP